MKAIAGILLVLMAILPGIDDIARVNKLKKEAEVAYLAGEYDKASQAYIYLTDSLGIADDKLFLNLGHSLFQQGDSTQAFSQYQRLINSDDKSLKSIALNQMGVISNKPGERQSALNFFKEALKNDPTNDEARYNYQLVKRQADEEKEQQQDQEQNKENEEKKEEEQKDQENKQDQNQNNQQQNQEQENQDQQKKDQQSENKEQNEQQQQNEEQQQNDEQKPEDQKKQEQQQSEQQDQEKKDGEQQPPQISPEKLKEMNISEEKARMILEAMRNSEIQYIQQNKRKGTKRPESTKPDW